MVLSLVELCVRSAIDNLSHLGDVGHTDMSLLEVILPHCDADQLLHIESSTEVRLSLSLSLRTSCGQVRYACFFWWYGSICMPFGSEAMGLQILWLCTVARFHELYMRLGI
jgi:hypothetical protein